MALYNQSLPLCNLSASRNPTVSDDSSCGFTIGSIWGRQTRLYKCSDATVGAAVWNLLGGGSSAYEEEIECDGTTESYTITHGKNTFSPIVAVWFLKLDEGVGFDAWIPQDITRGVYVNSTDSNSFFFNPTVYEGITSGLKYKIRVI